MNLSCQTGYWDKAASSKTFTHALPLDKWSKWVNCSSTILDVGCGYGRTCLELLNAGYTKVQGIDISPAMIQRGQAIDARLQLQVQTTDELPFPDSCFDAVCLIAVLTCVPENAGQTRIVSEIRRVLKPGGILFYSDFPIQQDERNQTRYKLFAEKYGTYGVFELSEGAVLRHQNPVWLDELFADFTLLDKQSASWTTMNGHSAVVEQRFYRLPDKH